MRLSFLLGIGVLLVVDVIWVASAAISRVSVLFGANAITAHQLARAL